MRCRACRTLYLTACCPNCIPFEPPSLADQIDAVAVLSLREGILCQRVVERRDEFGLLFVHAESNVEAIQVAMGMWGVIEVSARPV